MAFSTLRTCSSCGTANRIPAKHLADQGRCGVCKHALAAQSSPLEVDANGFNDIVSNAPVPVFVDFWAAWCGPCRMAAPEVEALARDLAGMAIVLKVDTEGNPAIAAQFRIQSIPNFVILHNGRVVFQHAGLAQRSEMRRWVEKAAAA